MAIVSDLGRALQRLRENGGQSQADVSGRLAFTPSRLSRLESGELSLTADEAASIAVAIGTPEARTFAASLKWEWRVLEAPGFDHPSLSTLWEAEKAIQRLDALRDDPDMKNAFLKQVESCRTALVRASKYLASTEHPIVFVGSVGVGKTAAICGLADQLRDSAEADLNRQMVLPTGSGRTTICEVHVRGGTEYAITVEPCSDEEIRHHVADFCEFLLNQTDRRTGTESNDGGGISAEVERAIRNMAGLTVKKTKLPDGKFSREDPALALVAQYPNKDELMVEILARLNLAKRHRTSVVFPKTSSLPPMKWTARSFTEINSGRHAEFSLPARIEVSIPGELLDTRDLIVRLIDTRGIDEPVAPRRDLQAYLDDDRAIIVLCSGFEDAPNAAVQAVIERASAGGLRKDFLTRGLLLILPKLGVERAVLSEATGEPVSDADEGREIRLEQVRTTTLTNLGARDLPTTFLDVRREDDCRRAKEFIRQRIEHVRSIARSQIEALVQTVGQLIENKADEQVRAVFAQATKPLQTWLQTNRTLQGEMERVNVALLEEIDGLRYASSLRASVNRRGDWHNFDYWHGLGFGARREVVERSKDQLLKVKGILENTLKDEDLDEAHSFLRHFDSQIDEAMATYFVEVQQLGETAFAEQLRGDHAYWQECQNRWGGGPGYKADIRRNTATWFGNDIREARHEFIDAEVQRRWEQMIDKLAAQLHQEPVRVQAKAALRSPGR